MRGLFVFFSSRRRHTRYWRDWSSDVCSSDLAWPSATASATRSAARLPLKLSGAITTCTVPSMPGVASGYMGDGAATDFYAVDDLLRPAEREIRDRVRAFCEKEVTPRINDYWERAEFPFEQIGRA